MPIVIRVPEKVELDQAIIDATMQLMKDHCAATTYAKFAASLAANEFPFTVTK